MAKPVTIEAYGRSYRINNPGGILGRSIGEGVPYEAQVLHHIYRQKLTGLAIDVGASIGNHTLYFAAICALAVLAFEPIECDRLRENIALNSKLPITVWPVALGEKPGHAKSIGKGQLASEDGGAIPVRRLDDFDTCGCSILKVDVEGWEADVLAGGRETIERDRPLIFAEAWDRPAHDRVAAILEPLGYSHVKTFGATPLEEWAP